MEKEKDLFHFVTSHHLETMKYGVRNKILPLKDWIIEMRRITYLYSESCRAKQRWKKHHFFLSTIIESVTYKNSFNPSRQAFNLRLPVYITVTSIHRFWIERGISAKYCRVLREVLIWFRERNSSSTFGKCTRFILSWYFLTETSEQHKGRLLAVVTFCLFFPMRFVSSSDFFRDDHN